MGLHTILFLHHAGMCDSAGFTAFKGHRLAERAGEKMGGMLSRRPEVCVQVLGCESLNSAWRNPVSPRIGSYLSP